MFLFNFRSFYYVLLSWIWKRFALNRNVFVVPVLILADKESKGNILSFTHTNYAYIVANSLVAKVVVNSRSFRYAQHLCRGISFN